MTKKQKKFADCAAAAMMAGAALMNPERVAKLAKTGAAKKPTSKKPAPPCDCRTCKKSHGGKCPDEIPAKKPEQPAAPKMLPPLAKQKPSSLLRKGEKVRMVLYTGDTAKLSTLEVAGFRRDSVVKTERGDLQRFAIQLKPVGFKLANKRPVLEVPDHPQFYGHNDWGAIYAALSTFPYQCPEERLLCEIYGKPVHDAKFNSLLLLAAPVVAKRLEEDAKDVPDAGAAPKKGGKAKKPASPSKRKSEPAADAKPARRRSSR